MPGRIRSVVTWQTIRYVEGENPWVTYTKKLVTTRNNCQNLVVTGKPGSSKSWSLLSYFCLIDPDFELSHNWFFRASNFMKEIKRDFKSKRILALDEAGIDLHNLQYYDQLNRGLNAFLQTARYKNYVFGLTVPFLSLISKGVRQLMTAQWRAAGWNSKNQSIIIPRVLEYNDELEKFYKKRLVVRTKERVVFCNRILLPKPPKKITKEYEVLKKEFTEELYDGLSKKMESFERKDQTRITRGMTTPEAEEVLTYLKQGKSVEDIAKLRGVSTQSIYGIMRTLTKKGVNIQAIKKNSCVIGYNIVDNR